MFHLLDMIISVLFSFFRAVVNYVKVHSLVLVHNKQLIYGLYIWILKLHNEMLFYVIH